MKKSELHKTVRAEVEKVLVEGKVAEAVKAKVLGIIDNYLEPKNAGRTVNLEEVVKRDKNGKITHIKCQLSGLFLPATPEVFYEAKDGKGIEVEVNGKKVVLRRLSRCAEKARKEFIKTLNASKNAIMQDVLEGKMKPEEAKAKIAELEAKKPDYVKACKGVATN